MRKKILLALLILMFFFSVSAQNTEPIEIKNVLPGGYAETELTFFAFTDALVPIKVSIDGPIKDWVSISAENGFFASKDTPLKLKVKVEPPKNVNPATYSGTLIISAPTPANAITTSSFARTDYLINLSVGITTQEVKSLEVESVQAYDSIEGAPLYLTLVLKNNGNVVLHPQAQIRILNSANQEIYQTSNQIEILPTQEKQFDLALPIDLSEGDYFVQISILLDSQLKSQLTKSIHIYSQGSTIVNGALLSLQASPFAYNNSAVGVYASFANKGSVPVSAKLSGEAVKSDNKSIKIKFESKETIVLPETSEELSAFFAPQGSGKYIITAKVLYNNKQTESAKTSVSVRNEEIPLGFGAIPILFIALAAIVIWHLAKYPVKKQKSSRKNVRKSY